MFRCYIIDNNLRLVHHPEIGTAATILVDVEVEVTSQLAAVGIVEQISDGWRILTDQLPYSTDSEAASHYSRITIARIQRTNLVILLLYNWRPHDDRSSLGAMLCPQCAG